MDGELFLCMILFFHHSSFSFFVSITFVEQTLSYVFLSFSFCVCCMFVHASSYIHVDRDFRRGLARREVKRILCVQRRGTRVKIERCGVVYVQRMFTNLLLRNGLLSSFLTFFKHSFYYKNSHGLLPGKGTSQSNINEYLLYKHTSSYLHTYPCMYTYTYVCMYVYIGTYIRFYTHTDFLFLYLLALRHESSVIVSICRRKHSSLTVLPSPFIFDSTIGVYVHLKEVKECYADQRMIL